MENNIIEWAPFQVKPGVTESELLAASEALQQDFLAGVDGFVRRDLLRAGADQWCDLVVWRDAESAERVMTLVAESPVCHRYFALMIGADEHDPGAGVQHFSVRRSYPAV